GERVHEIKRACGCAVLRPTSASPRLTAPRRGPDVEPSCCDHAGLASHAPRRLELHGSLEHTRLIEQLGPTHDQHRTRSTHTLAAARVAEGRLRSRGGGQQRGAERHVALAEVLTEADPRRAHLGTRGAIHRGSSRRDFRRGREAETQLYRAYYKFRRQSPR